MKTTYVLTATLMVAGCAHRAYVPAPLETPAAMREAAQASVDVATVSQEVERILPGGSWDGQTWDETSLLAAALVYNPDLRAARAHMQTAVAEAKAARVSPGPSLSLSAEYALNSVESSPWLFGTALDQLIDRGGRRESRIAYADIAAAVAAFDYTASVWTVRTAIVTALGELDAAGQLETLYEEITPLRARQLAAVSAQVAEGAASGSELDLIRQAQATDALGALAAGSRYRSGWLALASAVGVRVDVLRDRRLASPETPVVSDVGADILRNALAHRTEILKASAQYDEAEAGLRAAIAAQYPLIHIGPGYTWERGLTKLPFTLTLDLPGRDFGAAGIDAAEARREEAGRLLEASVARVGNDIEQALDDYRAASENLNLIETQTLPTARSLVEQADNKIEAGLINRSQWSDARIGALSAEIDRVNAVQSLVSARARLEAALRQSFGTARPAVGLPPTETRTSSR